MACSVKGTFYRVASLTLFLAAVFLFSTPANAQGAAAKPAENKDPGIPVTDPLVKEKCGRCHLADAKGNLSRISNVRTTPEGWEEAIKRMIRLNDLQVTPDEARKILRYLSNTHGLAPEEAAPVEYYSEHRIVDEKFTDPDVRHACASCHAIARPLSWRRSPEDWKHLVDMHVAFFPSVEATAFRSGGGRRAAATEGEENNAPHKDPVDKAIEFIQKATPLHTPEWAAWQASVTAPRLAGRWLVSGYQPGKGKFFGETVIAAGASEDQFTTKTTLHYIDGSSTTLTEQGASIVYTGFQWRGRSTIDNAGTAIGAPKTVREVMLLSKDQSELEGRWFWGVYQEFGMDVKLRRSQTSTTLLGTDIFSIHAGTTNGKITIYGDHLPQDVSAADINLGAGIKVTGIAQKSPDAVTVTVDVAANALPGPRAASVSTFTIPNAFAVYQKVDFVRVTPVTSLAHLGSEPHAKGYVQFEALGYSFGADGKANTADDINLGPMPAAWKLEEFVASYGDDDIQYVGALDAKTGLFTPSSDGPSKDRRSMRNNYGDVWAVASVTPEGAKEPITGRSYLVVSVPQYVQYDQPEVAQ